MLSGFELYSRWVPLIRSSRVNAGDFIWLHIMLCLPHLNDVLDVIRDNSPNNSLDFTRQT